MNLFMSKTPPQIDRLSLANYAASLVSELGIPFRVVDDLGFPFPSVPGPITDPDVMREAIRSNDNAFLGFKSGPETGISVLNVYTNTDSDGLNSLESSGDFCPCCDVLIGTAGLTDDGFQPWTDKILMYTGQDEFPDMYSRSHEGVFLQRSNLIHSLPPTLHEKCGKNCNSRWSGYRGPKDLLECGVRFMTQEFYLSLRPSENNKDSIPTSFIRANLFEPIAEGERNNTLFKRLCYLRATKGLQREELISVAQVIQEKCFDKPFENPRELENIVKSVLKYPAKGGR